MILASHGIIGSQITQFVGLLDTYSGAAAAYSLRKLRSAYTGSAIRVRRSSDNTEQDIGFVDNVLDTSTLTSFCSGTNGFVKTWYDQSGNGRDATQATAANQPQIVSSGSVILDNGKPAFDFDGTNDALVFGGSLISSQSQITVIAVSKSSRTTLRFVATQGTGISNQAAGIAYNSSNKISLFQWAQPDNISNNVYNTQVLSFGVINGVNSNLYTNNANNTTIIYSSPLNLLSSKISIGISPTGSGSYYFGNLKEIIFYPSDQSSNRTGISSNINNFYSIY